MKLISKNIAADIVNIIRKKTYIRVFWQNPRLLPPITHPYTIEVELTNDCNMRCVHCHRRKMDRKIGFMSLDLFQRLVREIENYPGAFLRFVGQGESPLHPDFREMMEFVSNRSIKIELTSNGSIFDLYSPDEILDWDIDIIGISIDGLDKESYERIRKGGNYDRLVNQISAFHRRREERGRKYPVLVVRNVIFPDYSPEQIVMYKDFWTEMADQVTFNTLASFKKNTDSKLEVQQRCGELFFDAHIRYDGSVLLCQHHFLFTDQEVIGNLNEKSLKEIWKSERLNEMRLLHQQRDIPDFCCKCFEQIKFPENRENERTYNSISNPLIRWMNKLVKLT